MNVGSPAWRKETGQSFVDVLGGLGGGTGSARSFAT